VRRAVSASSTSLLHVAHAGCSTCRSARPPRRPRVLVAQLHAARRVPARGCYGLRCSFGQGPCYLASATPTGACEKWTKCTTCTVGVVCSDGSTAGDYPETQCTCGASGTWTCDPGLANASGCTSLPPRDAASPPSEPCGVGFVCPEAGTDIDCQPVVPAPNAVPCTLACGDLVQATCPGVGFSY
jgi:hypothetical protein